MDCLFCKIVEGKIPSTRVYEDNEVLAFRDINPVAPLHVLIIPKRHIESVAKLSTADEALAMKLISTARDIAQKEGFADKGYRIVLNTGASAGQSVKHLHLHLIAGRDFTWPPG